MSNSTLHDDIAYMKSLAEDGARPVVNGRVLFWAGTVFGLASVCHYGFEAGYLPQDNPWYPVFVWLSAGVLFAFALILSLRGRKTQSHPASQAVNSVWSGVGIAVAVLGACMFAASLREQSIETLTALIAPMVLILYGVGWWVAAVLSGQTLLKLICAGCFLAAPLIAFMAGMPEQMLAYAACLGLFAALPGWLLMRPAQG